MTKAEICLAIAEKLEPGVGGENPCRLGFWMFMKSRDYLDGRWEGLDFFGCENASARLLDAMPPDTVIHLKHGPQHDMTVIGVPIRPDPQTQINHREWTEDRDLKTAIALATCKRLGIKPGTEWRRENPTEKAGDV